MKLRAVVLSDTSHVELTVVSGWVAGTSKGPQSWLGGRAGWLVVDRRFGSLCESSRRLGRSRGKHTFTVFKYPEYPAPPLEPPRLNGAPYSGASILLL